MKGIGLILDRIRSEPLKVVLRLRYLALVADLPDPMEKAKAVLELAEFYRPNFPREALQTAYLVCRYDPKNLRAIQIIIDVFQRENRVPQVAFMRQYKEKLESKQSVTSNELFSDISKSGLFDPTSVDPAVSFNPGEEFLAEQLSGDFSRDDQSNLVEFLSQEKSLSDKSLKSTSAPFDFNPIEGSRGQENQLPGKGATFSLDIFSRESSPLINKPDGAGSPSPSTVVEVSLSSLSAIPSSLEPLSSLEPPSSLHPPSSLTLDDSLLSSRNSFAKEIPALDLESSVSNPGLVEVNLNGGLESQNIPDSEVLPDSMSMGSTVASQMVNQSQSMAWEDLSFETRQNSFADPSDIVLRSTVLLKNDEVEEKGFDFVENTQILTQLSSPKIDLNESELLEEKTVVSVKFPHVEKTSGSWVKTEVTQLSSDHRSLEASEWEEGTGDGLNNNGLNNDGLISDDVKAEGGKSAASIGPSETHSDGALGRFPGREAKTSEIEPFGKSDAQNLSKDLDSPGDPSRHTTPISGIQSAIWWQQALESHSKTTAVGRAEMDPESFSLFLLENLSEHKSPHEVIRRYLTTEQKQRLFSYFLNVSTPGMELLKIDIFMGIGAGLEAVQLIREYAEQGELELNSLVQRARTLWQVLGWKPFVWQGSEGREVFKRILTSRPSQRPSLEML